MRSVQTIVDEAIAAGYTFDRDVWSTYTRHTHIYVPCDHCTSWSTWAIVQHPPRHTAPMVLRYLRGLVPADELVIVASMTTVVFDDDNDDQLPIDVLTITNEHRDQMAFAHVHDDTVDFWFLDVGTTQLMPSHADNSNVTEIFKELRA